MNGWIRKIHRWVSVAFTAAVILNIVFVIRQENVLWVGLSALFPLVVLLFTGLYLFALPYATRWRSGRSDERQLT